MPGSARWPLRCPFSFPPTHAGKDKDWLECNGITYVFLRSICMFACFGLMSPLSFPSALWLIITGLALELCKHAESHQIKGNNNYTSVFINMFIRTKTSNRLICFIREAVIKPETEGSVLSSEIWCLVSLFLFFYYFVCSCCHSVQRVAAKYCKC